MEKMYRKIKYLILEEPTVEDLRKMLLGKKSRYRIGAHHSETKAYH